MKTLDDDVLAQIQAFMEQADAWMEDEDYSGAVGQFEDAFALVPEPITDWEVATQILTGIADGYFLQGGYQEAREALDEAVQCPGGLGNPFIHLRLGQCEFELGDMERAADKLARAFMGDGERVFEGEDPKYFAFVQTKLEPSTVAPENKAPAKPWWKFW